jgi:hypothetical protein
MTYLSRRSALRLLGAATLPTILGSRLFEFGQTVFAQATRPYGGQMMLHVSENGLAAFANAITDGSRPYTLGVIAGFHRLPENPAVFLSSGSVAVCSVGRKIGLLYLEWDGSYNQRGEEVQPVLATSQNDVFLANNESPIVPGFYEICLLCDQDQPARFYLFVNRKEALRLEAPRFRGRVLGQHVLLGGRAPEPTEQDYRDPRLWLGPDRMAQSDCDFLSVQGYHSSFAPNLFNGPANLLSFSYDLSHSEPQKVGGSSRSVINYEHFGLVSVEPQSIADPTILGVVGRIIASNLAPTVRLHSREQYFPSSVEWFLNRASLVAGSARKEWTDIYHADGFADPPEGLGVEQAGPLSPQILQGLSSSSHFGGKYSTDFRSLWPMAAAPGTAPHSSWSFWGSHQSPMSDYQIETLRGQPLVNDRCTAPCYCRVSRQHGYMFITYYFFYPYNGDMAPAISRVWDARPLADNSGWEAHIGDWERVTLRLSINPDAGTAALLDTTLEWHGNREVRNTAPFAFGPTPYNRLARFTVYSCWHSHAMHGEAGTYDTDTAVADDVADNGPEWRTFDNLVFIDEEVPWVRYNGLWGANVHLTGRLSTFGAYALKNGPEGPAFHDLWTESQTLYWPSRGTIAFE